MLSVAEIKPLLQHEDESIRRLALLSLSKLRHSEDEELVPLIVSSFFGLSEQTSSWLFDSLRWLPITDAGFESLLTGLDRFREAGRAEYAYNLREAAFAAPREVFSKYAEPLRAALSGHPADQLARIERRLETSTWSPEDLWEELQRLCRDGSSYERPFDFDYAQDLQYALRDCQYPDGETLVALLSSITPEDTKRWRLEDVLVELVGHRRMREAIPVLMDKLVANPEAETLLEDCPVALAQIDDVEIVRQFRARYATTHANFLYYGMNALDSLRFPETEDLLIDLLSRRKSLDPELLSLDVPQQIAESLCCLFSERGIPLVAELIREEGYDYQLVEYLPLKVIAVADALGCPLPEREEWIKAVEEDKQEWEQWRQRNSAQHPRGWGQPDWSDGDKWDDEPFEGYLPPGDYAPEPIRNTAPKVGRNDPCPCGSGKKYKKCCGKG